MSGVTIRETGTVDRFAVDRGFGFIRSDFGGGAVFFTAAALPPGVAVSAGDAVRYTIVEDTRGPRALAIEVLP
ncbi:MAG TPA: cold shock domain-containing protein [Acetobacteraceae bacterium]|nr:cold shock domain-containing protein [Acetobacteraceae bacterium]